MDIVVDYEAFTGNIIKELAYCCESKSKVYTFKPPYSHTFWTKEEARRNSYLIANEHGIKWYHGKYNYSQIPVIVESIKRENAWYYTKGSAKTKYLSDLFNCNFTNLEDFYCPEIKDLNDESDCYAYPNIHTTINFCAHRRVIGLADWLASFYSSDLFNILPE